MLSPLRNRFGIPGVISVIALVFAMFGGAYAASNGNGGDKATASAKAKKAKKGPRGPRGPKGDAGPAGPAGPAGLPGAKGSDGSNGQNGAPGNDGNDGTSVSSVAFGPTEEPGSEPCEGHGGVEMIADITTYVCNGEEGEPWTAGGTLPSNATETGMWSISSAGGKIFGILPNAYATISFPVPLADELGETQVHYITPTSTPTELEPCSDGVGDPPSVANPEAAPGNLCVFVSFFSEGATGPPQIQKVGLTGAGASTTGAVLVFEPEEGEPGENEVVLATGSFAVTAP